MLAQVEVQAKYAGYIDRQRDEIDQLRRHENLTLPAAMNYAEMAGLSTELQQKLDRTQPPTLARAAKIPGITPAALSLLAVRAKKLRGSTQSSA